MRRALRAAALFIAVAGLLASLLVPRPVHATTLRYQTVEQLAHDADVVVWGHVSRVGTRMERIAGGGLRPAREARVDVRELLLGQAGGALAVQLLGGAHPSGERRVHGEAELREGEEVVLFLTRSGNDLRVLGMGMGVLRVVRPPDGAPRLLRQLDDAALLDAQGRVLPALDESLSFDELRAAIGRARPAPRGSTP